MAASRRLPAFPLTAAEASGDLRRRHYGPSGRILAAVPGVASRLASPSALGAGNPQPQAFLNRLRHVRRQRPHRIEQLGVNSERGEFLRVTVRHGENRMNKLATWQVDGHVGDQRGLTGEQSPLRSGQPSKLGRAGRDREISCRNARARTTVRSDDARSGLSGVFRLNRRERNVRCDGHVRPPHRV